MSEFQMVSRIEGIADFAIIEIPFPDGHGTASIQLRHTVAHCQADVLQIEPDDNMLVLANAAFGHECEESATWAFHGATIAEQGDGDLGWRIAVDPDVPGNATGLYGLWWTDGINQWQEEFDTLSGALAKLILLLETDQ